MTLTISSGLHTTLGHRHTKICSLAFDSSYSFGGEALTAGSLGLGNIDLALINPVKGYSFEYDRTNSKIKVFQPAPPIVYEEKHTILAASSHVVTLKYPAAFVMNVASGTAHYEFVDVDDTPASGEINYTAVPAASTLTTLTCNAAQVNEVIYVTYITQAWKDVWDNIVEETLTTATHVASSTNVIIGLESCYGTHAATPVSSFEYIRGGDAAATGEVEIDLTDSGNTNLTTLTFAAGDAITGAKVRYIKKPSAGFLADRFLEDVDNANTSGVAPAARPLLFHTLAGKMPDYHASNERDCHNLQMLQLDALGTTGEFAIDYQFTTTTTGTPINTNDSMSDAISLSYIYGTIPEIPNVVPLEVADTEDLSGLTGLRAMFVGR